jgi:hypothetical protein
VWIALTMPILLLFGIVLGHGRLSAWVSDEEGGSRE